MKVDVIGGSAWFVGALATILEGERGFDLAYAEADLPAFRRRLNGSAEPRILIVGCEADGTDIADVMRWVRRSRPELRVVVKMRRLRPDLVRDAMEAGCRGCFSTEDSPGTVTSVLRSVAEGRVSFPFVDLSVLRDDPFERLTRRERDVLGALAQGWSNTQISARLGISENTVKYHLKLIYDKLGVGNRAMAVARYLERCPA